MKDKKTLNIKLTIPYNCKENVMTVKKIYTFEIICCIEDFNHE
jgi:hypothetical protein